jgi:hypothetical protein
VVSQLIDSVAVGQAVEAGEPADRDGVDDREGARADQVGELPVDLAEALGAFAVSSRIASSRRGSPAPRKLLTARRPIHPRVPPAACGRFAAAAGEVSGDGRQ